VSAVIKLQLPVLVLPDHFFRVTAGHARPSKEELINTVAQNRVNGNTSSQREKANYDHLQNQNPSIKKFGTVDYINSATFFLIFWIHIQVRPLDRF